MSQTINQIIMGVAVVVWVLLLIRAFRQWRIMKRWVEPKELKHRLDNGEDILVLDVRTPEEFKDDGHIEGAVNLPLRGLGARVSEVRADMKAFADTPIVVVCKVGGRSTAAVPHLMRRGLKQTRIMRGGMRRWIEQGLPIQKE